MGPLGGGWSILSEQCHDRVSPNDSIAQLEESEMRTVKTALSHFDHGCETGAPPELVVLLHGVKNPLRCKSSNGPRSLKDVKDAVRSVMPGADIFVPDLALGPFSLTDAEAIAEGLVSDLDEYCAAADAKGRSYSQIVFVGHSYGSILVRKLFVLAHGAMKDATIEPARARQWAPKISRLIMLAGMNRGWTTTSALTPLTKLRFQLATLIGHLLRLVTGQQPVTFDVRRGAPFLTLLRLQWLAIERQLKVLPLTVQLLGTIDDFVSPDDHIDLATGFSFIYREVRHSGHLDLVHMQSGAGRRRKALALQEPGPCGERKSEFIKALTLTADELRQGAIPVNDVSDLVQTAVDNYGSVEPTVCQAGVSDVVFVVHGIRDKGFWTKKVARQIQRQAHASGREARTVTSTYGYFAMLPFVLPCTRMSKVEWLLDQYVMAKFLYPNATFSYIGHSNGTYLLVKALELCRAVHFERVVFAGSVVRRHYDWQQLIDSNRVAKIKILNYVASADWVVALCTKGLGLLDLGSAGHDGFARKLPEDVLQNLEYVPGGHAAALDEENWEDIARFALNGEWPAKTRLVLERECWVVCLGRISPLVRVIVPALVLFVGLLILHPISLHSLMAVLFTLYVGALLYLLNQF
jgi:hypothetical protein